MYLRDGSTTTFNHAIELHDTIHDKRSGTKGTYAAEEFVLESNAKLNFGDDMDLAEVRRIVQNFSYGNTKWLDENKDGDASQINKVKEGNKNTSYIFSCIQQMYKGKSSAEIKAQPNCQKAINW